MKKYLKISLVIDYTLLGKVENYLVVNKIYEISRDYTEKVLIYLYIIESEFETIQKDLIEMTSANIEIDIVEKKLLADNNRVIIEGEEDGRS